MCGGERRTHHSRKREKETQPQHKGVKLLALTLRSLTISSLNDVIRESQEVFLGGRVNEALLILVLAPLAFDVVHIGIEISILSVGTVFLLWLLLVLVMVVRGVGWVREAVLMVVRDTARSSLQHPTSNSTVHKHPPRSD